MPDANVHFRSMLRGYDPAQVDQRVHQLVQEAGAARQEAAELTIAVSRFEATHVQLQSEVESHAQRVRALEEAQLEAAVPTYAGLGERIGSILTLVDKEAHELRTRAQADAANSRALADESALATRQDADDYAMETRTAADDEVARLLEDAKLQVDSLLNDARAHADSLQNDADRQAMTRREEAEAVYELARARSAAAAVDFETTLAARRDTSALEFAAQVTTAEQQLAAVRLRSERVRSDSEQAQQESESKSAQQLEQAMAHARTLVAEAKTKAERIRGNSERELAAATQRRDNISAQLSNVRRDLAALGGVTRFNPSRLDEPADRQSMAAAEVQQEAGAKGQAGSSADQVGEG